MEDRLEEDDGGPAVLLRDANPRELVACEGVYRAEGRGQYSVVIPLGGLHVAGVEGMIAKS